MLMLGVVAIGSVPCWWLAICAATSTPPSAACAGAVSNAARTNLMNLETCQWHAPFVQLFGLTEAALPRIVSNAEVRGSINFFCLNLLCIFLHLWARVLVQ